MYELTRLTYPSCPECGTAFDPGDMATTLRAPIPHWKRSPIVRVGVRVALVLLVISAFVHTAFPRPVSLDDWRLWVWMHMWFGVRESVFDDVIVRQTFWAGHESAREVCERSSGDLRWRMRVWGGDRWTLTVKQAGVPWDAVVGAFNSMKGDWFFGIHFRSGGEPRVSKHPFEARGTMVGLLSAIMDHFEVEIQPFRLRPEQEYVWVFDEASRRMATVEVTPESLDIYPYRAGFQHLRLVPRSFEEKGTGGVGGAAGRYLPGHGPE